MWVRSKSVRIMTMLCFLLLLGFVTERAAAAGGEPNITYTINDTAVEQGTEISVEPGEEIKVVISVCDMTVATWAGGLNFDKDKLEVVSITGPDEAEPEEFFAIKKETNKPLHMQAASTVEESNRSGSIGFCWIIAEEVSVNRSKIATAIIRVKKNASGLINISLFENSAGKDGYVEDPIFKSKVALKIKEKNDVITGIPEITPTISSEITPIITPVITTVETTITGEVMGDITAAPTDYSVLTGTITNIEKPEITPLLTDKINDGVATMPVEYNGVTDVITLQPTSNNPEEKTVTDSGESKTVNSDTDNVRKEKTGDAQNDTTRKNVAIIIICAIVAISSYVASTVISNKKRREELNSGNINNQNSIDIDNSNEIKNDVNNESK